MFRITYTKAKFHNRRQSPTYHTSLFILYIMSIFTFVISFSNKVEHLILLSLLTLVVLMWASKKPKTSIIRRVYILLFSRYIVIIFFVTEKGITLLLSCCRHLTYNYLVYIFRWKLVICDLNQRALTIKMPIN